VTWRALTISISKAQTVVQALDFQPVMDLQLFELRRADLFGGAVKRRELGIDPGFDSGDGDENSKRDACDDRLWISVLSIPLPFAH
jgi:hypothetical protein